MAGDTSPTTTPGVPFRTLTKPERVIVVILRVFGVAGLFAIPAIFLPYSWMNRIHESLGMGELPDEPIVSYLARSLSMFYAVVSVMLLFVSRDIRYYRSFVKLWATLVVLTGCTMFGIDFFSGLPMFWTLSEGPPTVAVGGTVLYLSRSIQPVEL